jgi:uridine phosphorylase
MTDGGGAVVEWNHMEERFTPSMVVEDWLARHGLTREALGVAPVVVLSWGRRIVDALAQGLGAERSAHWLYGERHPLYVGSIAGRPVSIVHLPTGAPATVLLMEELIACGARAFLGLGWAGSLQPAAPIGTLLIPIACRREEGTSLHYIPHEADLQPDPRLWMRLREACQREGVLFQVGPLWTTDAPYRETVDRIERYRKEGVVVSDELWGPWRPAFGRPELQRAEEQAERVLLRTLEALAAQDPELWGGESGGR